jgi:hypothetical protein
MLTTSKRASSKRKASNPQDGTDHNTPNKKASTTPHQPNPSSFSYNNAPINDNNKKNPDLDLLVAVFQSFLGRNVKELSRRAVRENLESMNFWKNGTRKRDKQKTNEVIDRVAQLLLLGEETVPEVPMAKMMIEHITGTAAGIVKTNVSDSRAGEVGARAPGVALNGGKGVAMVTASGVIASAAEATDAQQYQGQVRPTLTISKAQTIDIPPTQAVDAEAANTQPDSRKKRRLNNGNTSYTSSSDPLFVSAEAQTMCTTLSRETKGTSPLRPPTTTESVATNSLPPSLADPTQSYLSPTAMMDTTTSSSISILDSTTNSPNHTHSAITAEKMTTPSSTIGSISSNSIASATVNILRRLWRSSGSSGSNGSVSLSPFAGDGSVNGIRAGTTIPSAAANIPTTVDNGHQITAITCGATGAGFVNMADIEIGILGLDQEAGGTSGGSGFNHMEMNVAGNLLQVISPNDGTMSNNVKDTSIVSTEHNNSQEATFLHVNQPSPTPPNQDMLLNPAEVPPEFIDSLDEPRMSKAGKLTVRVTLKKMNPLVNSTGSAPAATTITTITTPTSPSPPLSNHHQQDQLQPFSFRCRFSQLSLEQVNVHLKPFLETELWGPNRRPTVAMNVLEAAAEHVKSFESILEGLASAASAITSWTFADSSSATSPTLPTGSNSKSKKSYLQRQQSKQQNSTNSHASDNTFESNINTKPPLIGFVHSTTKKTLSQPTGPSLWVAQRVMAIYTGMWMVNVDMSSDPNIVREYGDIVLEVAAHGKEGGNYYGAVGDGVEEDVAVAGTPSSDTKGGKRLKGAGRKSRKSEISAVGKSKVAEPALVLSSVEETEKEKENCRDRRSRSRRIRKNENENGIGSEFGDGENVDGRSVANSLPSTTMSVSATSTSTSPIVPGTVGGVSSNGDVNVDDGGDGKSQALLAKAVEEDGLDVAIPTLGAFREFLMSWK